MTVVGVDVSSRRVDLAWLENGKPCRWHQDLGGPKTHLIDRLRSIRINWPPDEHQGLPAGHGITDVAVEYPFGRGNAIAALMATVGVITRQAPPWARVAWPSSGELRAAIGARNTKDSAHGILYLWHAGQLDGWDEHELDALIACIGWTRILAAQDDA